MAKHKLVQHDTLPQINLSITDEVTGAPIDLSDPATIIQCFFKAAGPDAPLKDTLLLAKLPGRVTSIDEDTGAQTVTLNPPWDTPGRGGRCAIQWGPTTLDTVGKFTGEVQVTFGAGGKQTVYQREQFDVRADDDGA